MQRASTLQLQLGTREQAARDALLRRHRPVVTGQDAVAIETSASAMTAAHTTPAIANAIR